MLFGRRPGFENDENDQQQRVGLESETKERNEKNRKFPAKQRHKSKKELTFEERLRRNKEEQEREAKRNAEEQKMLERHAQQTKEMEEEEENEELKSEHANETQCRRLVERERRTNYFKNWTRGRNRTGG